MDGAHLAVAIGAIVVPGRGALNIWRSWLSKRIESATGRGRGSLLLGLAALVLGTAAPAVAQQADWFGSERLRPSDQDVAREIRDEAGGRIKEFYKSRSYRPLWVSEGRLNEAAHRLIGHIENAGIDGLDPRDYSARKLRELVGQAARRDPESLAEAELMLSQEFARLVSDMRRPRVGMHYAEDGLEPDRLREDDVLRRAALARSFPDYIATMGWMHPLYVGLRQQLGDARAQAERPPIIVPTGPSLSPGDSGERVALLRRRLGVAEGWTFDEELARAVRSFQRGQGLAPDGLAGPRTLAALNRAVSVRPANFEQALRVNLERARLLPDAWTKHIVVNAAAAHLTYYAAGEEQGAMKVVVGTPETPTPMMAGMIRYATYNPFWNVPVDLAASLLAPRVLSGHSLEGMGYEALSDWSRNARVIDSTTINWKGVASGKTTVRVRQLPGPGNSMGDVKFMFPNDLGIYLHDTPSRALFDEEARQFSNGCVRLEDAGRLGEWLFGRELNATTNAPEQHRPLAQPVPVYLTYLTAVPAGQAMAYFPDVYSRDGRAAPQLASK